jgi:peptidoglycan/LPS O-acetylase OafA/YrhL
MAEPREIRSLNTLRGLAALMVAGFHAPMLFGVKAWLPHAYLAVDLFFVLSGFVMAHAYGGRIAEGLSFGRFAQLRLARLYPLYAFATLAGFALLMLKASQGFAVFRLEMVQALGLNLALAPAPMAAAFRPDGAAFPFAVPAWSIFWELVLCAAFYLWARHVRRGAWLIAAAGAVVLGAVAGHFDTLDGGWTWSGFWIGGLRALYAFSAGVAVQRLVRARLTSGTATPKLADIGIRLLGLAALAYIIGAPHANGLVELAIVGLVLPLAIGAVALSRSPLIENRLGDLVGAASYSVYMLHPVLIELTVAVLNRAPHLSPSAQRFFGSAWMIGLVVAAFYCWKWFETPARRLLSRPISLPGLAPGSAVQRVQGAAKVRDQVVGALKPHVQAEQRAA